MLKYVIANPERVRQSSFIYGLLRRRNILFPLLAMTIVIQEFLNLLYKQVCVSLKCSVHFSAKYCLCKYLTKLYTFLVEAVDVPDEALEHYLVLEVCKEGTDCCWVDLLSVDKA